MHCIVLWKGVLCGYFYLFEDNPIIYTIPKQNKDGDKNGSVRRFWDVFMSWGENLGFIEKFNMASTGVLSNKNPLAVTFYQKKALQHHCTILEEGLS